MTTPKPNSLFDEGAAAQRKRGRKVGSRAKLGARFFEDFYAAWEEQGESLIARAMFHDPVAVLGIAARLMPQKVEVSLPTDGLTDEQLLAMIDVAERMVAFKGGQVIEGRAVSSHLLADENVFLPQRAEDRGEGAVGEKGGGGVNTSPTQRRQPKTADPTETAETPQTHNTVELPYPVGRPHPKADHEVERSNKAQLDKGDIDPQSLF